MYSESDLNGYAGMNDPEPPFVAGSPTSEAAAKSIRGKRSTQQRQLVLDILTRAGNGGLTDEEGCALTGLEGDSYRPRRVELLKMGIVEHVPDTMRKTRSGRLAQVWRARQ
jgi:hypothetical protein